MLRNFALFSRLVLLIGFTVSISIGVFAQSLARPSQGLVFVALSEQPTELLRLFVDHAFSLLGNASA